MSILNKLFSKKKKLPEEVSGYNEAIKMIDFYIATFEWEKAKQAIDEIRIKEENSYSDVLSKLQENEDIYIVKKEKEKLKKEFNRKTDELNKLSELFHLKQEEYNSKQDKVRFKIRFENITKEITSLSATGKNNEAMGVLNVFLEENKDKKIVIDFYNKQKKIIQRNIEKQRIIDEKKVKQNTVLEAMKLIGENVLGQENKEEKETDEEESFFKKLKKKLNFYKKIQENRNYKKTLDEVSLLIEENDKIKNDIAISKLENIHKGLIKELFIEKMLGYNFYGKILGADKISGDAFNFNETKEKYNFFIGDATGHGIRAGFIVTLLSKVFSELVGKKTFKELVFEINNSLKQDLQSRNFITSLFFEIKKDNLSNIQYIGMGHELMLIYKAKTKKAEKIIAGGLAAGIRLIKNPEDISTKELVLDDGDIICIYSDGVVESKNEAGEYYGINKLQEVFEKICQTNSSSKAIYEQLMIDLKYFKGGTNFLDDVTIIILQRDLKKDIVSENSNYIKKLQEEGKIDKKNIKKYAGKTKQEIEKEIEKETKAKQVKNIIANLENLYLSGEIIKLKEESIRFIKEGFIDPKINFFLRKAISNEQAYKIEKKQQRMENKYKVLQELMKKGDYSTVVRELENIIGKDGNI